jgi:NADPH:quinone reductase
MAVVADQLGPPENYALREHDPGPPAKGDVRIAIKAVGVSYADSLISVSAVFRPPCVAG